MEPPRHPPVRNKAKEMTLSLLFPSSKDADMKMETSFVSAERKGRVNDKVESLNTLEKA